MGYSNKNSLTTYCYAYKDIRKMFKIETIVDSCNECPYMMYQGGMAEHHYCNEILGSFIPPDKLDVIQEWCPYTQEDTAF